MNEKFTVANEGVDDVLVLLAQIERMGIQPTMGGWFPVHGNW
jgi:hypothetical protein